MADKFKLSENWIHLGLGATSEPQPSFSGMEWYGAYSERHASDGNEGRLVSQATFTDSWDVCEMHPNGSEIIICTEGEMTLIQEIDGGEKRISIRAGEYAINPAGIWHTADISDRATAIFITAGRGTEHKPR